MPRIKVKRNLTLMRMERWFSSNTFLRRFKCSYSKYSRRGWCNSSSKNFCSSSSKWQSNRILASQRCLVCLTEFNLTKTSATFLQSLSQRQRRDTLTWLQVLIRKAEWKGRAIRTPPTKEICSLRLAEETCSLLRLIRESRNKSSSLSSSLSSINKICAKRRPREWRTKNGPIKSLREMKKSKQ